MTRTQWKVLIRDTIPKALHEGSVVTVVQTFQVAQVRVT